MEGLGGRGAEHGHIAGEFGLGHFEDGLDAWGAVGGEGPEDGAAEQDGVGAEDEGFEDVGATTEAAVDKDGEFAVEGGGDGG